MKIDAQNGNGDQNSDSNPVKFRLEPMVEFAPDLKALKNVDPYSWPAKVANNKVLQVQVLDEINRQAGMQADSVKQILDDIVKMDKSQDGYQILPLENVQPNNVDKLPRFPLPKPDVFWKPAAMRLNPTTLTGGTPETWQDIYSKWKEEVDKNNRPYPISSSDFESDSGSPSASSISNGGVTDKELVQ